MCTNKFISDCNAKFTLLVFTSTRGQHPTQDAVTELTASGLVWGLTANRP